MSSAMAFIKFKKTGNIYCGCYNGTVDIMYDCFCEYNPNISIFDYCSEHADDSIDIKRTNKIDDLDEIEIYSDYGGGFYWKGTGSEKYKIIVKGLDPWNNNNTPWDGASITDGMPGWVNNYFMEIFKN